MRLGQEDHYLDLWLKATPAKPKRDPEPYAFATTAFRSGSAAPGSIRGHATVSTSRTFSAPWLLLILRMAEKVLEVYGRFGFCVYGWRRSSKRPMVEKP